MEMKIIKTEKQLCPCCMEEHEVKTVRIREQATFKGRKVDYEASYQYCDSADELFMEEEQIRDNDVRMKDAYRMAEGLLTSEDIRTIRGKFGISQGDLCMLLGWGGKTITRYESHQVQDKAHDSLLKRLDRDPEWFLSLLEAARGSLSAVAYRKYRNNAAVLLDAAQDAYPRKKFVDIRNEAVLERDKEKIALLLTKGMPDEEIERLLEYPPELILQVKEGLLQPA